MKKEFKINVFFTDDGIEVNNTIEKYLLFVIQNGNYYNVDY